MKFYEKGDRPLEIITSRQWFIKTMDFRDALLAARPRAAVASRRTCRRGSRTGSTGLNGDWCVSRQRFFGVPFPVWYRVREDGTRRSRRAGCCRAKIGCRSIRRPTCPTATRPEQRDQPGGFTGDPDIMDTWATSSLTPQIAGGWEDDPDLFARVFPMDVRPQAHDIIRTWLFSTVLRAELEHGSLPWTNAAISGWVLDPDRKKMSKSKGNVVTPMGLLEEHGSDGVRYWAASGRPGTDTAFDPGQMKVGRRLAIKLLNASKFVLAQAEPRRAGHRSRLDRGLLTSLARLVDGLDRATLEDYDYARVLERTETFFWSFCDDYLELVKSRRYGDHGAEAAASAKRAARARCRCCCGCSRRTCRSSTEEVWSWWQPGSVHTRGVADGGGDRPRSAAPTPRRQRALEAAHDVLGEIREKKSIEKRPLKARIAEPLTCAGMRDAVRWLPDVEHGPSRAAGVDQRFVYVAGDERLSRST